MFLRDYMEYHSDRFEDCSVTVWDGERLVSVLPASRHGDTAVSHGGLTFGPLLSPNLSSRSMLGVFDAVAGVLKAAGCSSWIYKPAPHIYHLVPAEEDLYALFRHAAELVRRDIGSAIAMGNRGPYSKGRRSSVARSRRDGLSVERESDFRPFVALLEEVLDQRYDASPVHTADELQMLADRFTDGIKLYTARADGVLLGGVVVYETPTVGRAQYAGASDHGRRLGAVDAIIDTLLSDDLRDKRYFDFGTSMDPQSGEPNFDLLRNKESYGATAVVYDRYAVPLT
jgi:hypothetical protein